MLIGLELAGAFGEGGWTLAAIGDLASKAEAKGVAFVSLPDVIADQAGQGGWPDATILLGWLAAKTQRIGLVAATGTGGHQPYNLARRIASLDRIAKGRIGWWLRDEGAEAEHAAFSGPVRLPNGNTPERIAEFVEVVEGLWHGWDADALLFDKARGRFLDPAKMHTLDHSGTHFSVRGPLNVMRSPQDRPVLFVSGHHPNAVADRADVIVSDEDGSSRGKVRFARLGTADQPAKQGESHGGVLFTFSSPAAAEHFLSTQPTVSRPTATLRETLTRTL